MAKKIMISFFAMLSIFVFYSYDAYALTSDGSFQNNIDFKSAVRTQTIQNINNMFDSDDSSYTLMGIGSSVTITFNEPVNIGELSVIISSDPKAKFQVEFYKETNSNTANLLSTQVFSNSVNNQFVGLSNVKMIYLKSTASTVFLNDIKFYDGLNLLPSVYSAIAKPRLTSVDIDYEIKNATTLEVYKGSDLLAVGDGSGSLNIEDLQPETNYNFSLYAVNASGDKSEMPYLLSFKTLDDPSKIPPSIVKVLSADDITHESVLLRWVNPDDDDLSKAIIYDSSNKKVGEVDSTQTNFFIDGLESEKSYSYSVKMLDKDGNYSVPVSVSFLTLKKPIAPDTTPPVMPTIIRVSSGDSVIDAVWTFNSEPDFAGYNIYLDGVKVNDTPYKHDNYRFSSLENGRVYKIEVEAVDVSGNKSTKMTASASPVAPKIPSVALGGINLKDVADGIANWFGGLWLIIAFAVGIPLALLIANRVKQLFLR